MLEGTYIKEKNTVRLEIDEDRLNALIKKCKDLNRGKS